MKKRPFSFKESPWKSLKTKCQEKDDFKIDKIKKHSLVRKFGEKVFTGSPDDMQQPSRSGLTNRWNYRWKMAQQSHWSINGNQTYKNQKKKPKKAEKNNKHFRTKTKLKITFFIQNHTLPLGTSCFSLFPFSFFVFLRTHTHFDFPKKPHQIQPYTWLNWKIWMFYHTFWLLQILSLLVGWFFWHVWIFN